MKNLVIMGANNPEIIRLIDSINNANQEKINLLGFVDNEESKKGSSILGYEVLGTPDILSEEKYNDCFVVNNITRDPETRKITTEQLEKYNKEFLNLIHPSVNLGYVEVGKGVLIYEGCILSPRVNIKDHATIMLGVIIAHDGVVGEFSFIGPGAIINGMITIGREVFIGSGATILPRLTIGNYAKIGAGSLIGENIKDNLFVIGNPARAIPINSAPK